MNFELKPQEIVPIKTKEDIFEGGEKVGFLKLEEYSSGPSFHAGFKLGRGVSHTGAWKNKGGVYPGRDQQGPRRSSSAARRHR